MTTTTTGNDNRPSSSSNTKMSLLSCMNCECLRLCVLKWSLLVCLNPAVVQFQLNDFLFCLYHIYDERCVCVCWLIIHISYRAYIQIVAMICRWNFRCNLIVWVFGIIPISRCDRQTIETESRREVNAKELILWFQANSNRVNEINFVTN